MRGLEMRNNLQELDEIMDDGLYKDALKCLYETFDTLPKRVTQGCHLHHLIPRFFFKAKKVDVDNSLDNLVSLPVERHILAHYFMWKGANNKFRGLAGLAFQFLISKSKVQNIGKAFDFAMDELLKDTHGMRIKMGQWATGKSYEEMYGVVTAEELKNSRRNHAVRQWAERSPTLIKCVETGEIKTTDEWAKTLGVTTHQVTKITRTGEPRKTHHPSEQPPYKGKHFTKVYDTFKGKTND